MKPMSLLINTCILAALSVTASALTVDTAGGKPEKALNRPDVPSHNSVFRSDSTLRFMRKIHATHLTPKEEEAARSKLCGKHGFKAKDRSRCEAFMREACHKKAPHSALSRVALESCIHFFREEQPGYSKASNTKLSAKKSQKSDAKKDPVKDLQAGPEYESKKAQKATDKVADEQKAAKEEKGTFEKAGDAVADANEAVVDAVTGGAEAVTRDRSDAAEEEKEEKDEKEDKASEEPEEPEEKEDPSDPGCRNSPKGWEDKKGKDCEDYSEGEWCTRRGGYGDGWLDDWGKFEDVANKGKSANQVCCTCGGGLRAAPAGAPGPSPMAAAAPGPAGPTILGGKTGRELQSQGYSGKLVEHEDMSTMTEDWGREFGPSAGHRDIKSICAQHPGNEWCDLHGYYDTERSAASFKSLALVFVSLFFACLR